MFATNLFKKQESPAFTELFLYTRRDGKIRTNANYASFRNDLPAETYKVHLRLNDSKSLFRIKKVIKTSI